ncbi:hypothetical protein HK102_011688 [Quaeritorhiza haematococci]|nr:hypothetical protein HK102_011688 [Quaeritorhiza haematococci]
MEAVRNGEACSSSYCRWYFKESVTDGTEPFEAGNGRLYGERKCFVEFVQKNNANVIKSQKAAKESHDAQETYEFEAYFRDDDGEEHEFYANRRNTKKNVWRVIIDGQQIKQLVTMKRMGRLLHKWAGGRHPAYHASENAIDYHRFVTIYDSITDVLRRQQEQDEPDYFDVDIPDKPQDHDKEEEETAQPPEHNYPKDNHNPFPSQEQWLNTGAELCMHVFGPKRQPIRTAYWKLDIIHQDLWDVGDSHVAKGDRIANIPENARNVRQDARKTWNLIQVFRDLQL